MSTFQAAASTRADALPEGAVSIHEGAVSIHKGAASIHEGAVNIHLAGSHGKSDSHLGT